MPTGWITGAFTGLFLLVTAAFGGLAKAPTPGLTTIEAGERYENAQLALQIERAVLIDTFVEAGASAGPGERVLAVSVLAENRWRSPLITTGDHSVSQALRVQGLGDAAPTAVARMDDATLTPWLQPGVPAELVVTWVIADDALSEGDEVEFVIRDAVLHTGKAVTYGESWVDAKPAARVLTEVIDVGAGGGASDE